MDVATCSFKNLLLVSIILKIYIIIKELWLSMQLIVLVLLVIHCFIFILDYTYGITIKYNYITVHSTCMYGSW